MFLYSLELTRQFSYAVHWSPSIRNKMIALSVEGGGGGGGEWERERKQRKTSFISSRHRPVSISFELTNWANLSIIFDLFGVAAVVCTNDVGLPQTMLAFESSEWERERERWRKRKTFCISRLLLRIHFPDQTNTRGRKKANDKRRIKWIYVGSWETAMAFFGKSCLKCVMKIEGGGKTLTLIHHRISKREKHLLYD